MPSVDEGTLVEQGALPPDDFHSNIERIREIAKFDLEWADDFFARLERATERDS